MPLFFFHLTGDHTRRDEEGYEFQDPHAAWVEAVRTCGEMIRDQYKVLEPARPWGMDVLDEEGCLIFSLRFAGNARTDGDETDAG